MIKKLQEMPNTVVNTKTKEEYDKLMRIYEEAGWKWNSGNLPTTQNYWGFYKEDTCLDIQNQFGWGKQGWFSKDYNIISFDEFLEEQGLIEAEYNTVSSGNVSVTLKHPLSKLKVNKSTKQNKMNKLTKTQKRVLNKDQQALYKVDYLYDDLELNPEGRQALTSILLEEYEEKLANEAREKLEEEKED